MTDIAENSNTSENDDLKLNRLLILIEPLEVLWGWKERIFSYLQRIDN